MRRVADNGRACLRRAFVAVIMGFCARSSNAQTQPAVIIDPADDCVIRRTDAGNNGPINPNTQRLPEIIQMRIGRFTPNSPQYNFFSGAWSSNGGFMRFDMVLAGLINPPGPLGFSDWNPVYAPFLYGPNPIYGWVEMDMDIDENTGGEVSAPEYRYLGNISRFGGLPQKNWLSSRAAIDYTACDGDIMTSPFVERSGEEFHIAFLGEHIEGVYRIVEKPGGNPADFEPGETWVIEGHPFHRNHGVELFSFQCLGREGHYKPEVYMRFSHDLKTDHTTISLVYPLNNVASAAMISPSTPVESNDGCDFNQNSVEEAMADLKWGAINATPFEQLEPDFVLLAGWADKTPADHLDASQWRLTALVGTAYGTEQPDQARFVWTDAWPNVRAGDYNGDCALDTMDMLLLNAYITAHDGQAKYDDDGIGSNGSLQLHYFADAVCLFDANYDGYVQTADGLVGGDMDLNAVFDLNDVPDFVLALIDPGAYSLVHSGVSPVARGDMNCDGLLNGADIQPFVDRLMGY